MQSLAFIFINYVYFGMLQSNWYRNMATQRVASNYHATSYLVSLIWSLWSECATMTRVAPDCWHQRRIYWCVPHSRTACANSDGCNSIASQHVVGSDYFLSNIYQRYLLQCRCITGIVSHALKRTFFIPIRLWRYIFTHK